jgi:hypothetical protein
MTDLTETRGHERGAAGSGSDANVPRSARPVVGWAVVGSACIALTVYEWAAWLVRGHAQPAPVGGSPLPDWLRVSLLVWQIVFPAAAAVVLWRVLVRPWLRERTLTFDGMFLIAWISAWAMQDSWFNYTRQWFNYNAALWNLGCPQCEVPGWQSPHGDRVAEPLFTLSLYIFALFMGCLMCNGIMRAAKRRWPMLGTAGLVGVALGSMAVADVLCETIWARTGTFSYVAAIPEVTLFAGHYYQYPVTQAIIWGFPWALIACLRYFRNDRGETLAERGLSRVRVGGARRTGIRLLAVIGLLNVVFFLTSNVPNQFFGTHAGAVPQDILNRGYLLNGQCGPGTDQACPGPRVPMPVGPQSGHATPEGGFAAPAGLPNQVTKEG